MDDLQVNNRKKFQEVMLNFSMCTNPEAENSHTFVKNTYLGLWGWEIYEYPAL